MARSSSYEDNNDDAFIWVALLFGVLGILLGFSLREIDADVIDSDVLDEVCAELLDIDTAQYMERFGTSHKFRCLNIDKTIELNVTGGGTGWVLTR